MKAIAVLIFVAFCACTGARQGDSPTRDDGVKLVVESDTKEAVQDLVIVPVVPEVLPVVDVRSADSVARAAHIADSLEFRRITKLINGGYNGFDDRWKIYLRAKKVLYTRE